MLRYVLHIQPAVMGPDMISTGCTLQVSVLRPDGRRFPSTAVQ